MPPLAALQQADRLGRQPGTVRELFLRKAGGLAQRLEPCPERGVFPGRLYSSIPLRHAASIPAAHRMGEGTTLLDRLESIQQCSSVMGSSMPRQIRGAPPARG